MTIKPTCLTQGTGTSVVNDLLELLVQGLVVEGIKVRVMGYSVLRMVQLFCIRNGFAFIRF